MLSNTGGKGFGITFKNGVTVSVQWGPSNYCEHYDNDFSNEDFRQYQQKGEWGKWRSEHCEIAIITPDKWVTREWKPDCGDDVAGWCTAEDALDAMNWGANYKPEVSVDEQVD